MGKKMGIALGTLAATAAVAATQAMDLSDVHLPPPAREVVRFETWKGKPMLAMTGADWHAATAEQVESATRGRAEAVCVGSGFSGLSDYATDHDDGSRVYAVFEGGSFVERREEGAVELDYGLGIVTAVLGAPLWSDPRYYRYVACWRPRAPRGRTDERHAVRIGWRRPGAEAAGRGGST